MDNIIPCFQGFLGILEDPLGLEGGGRACIELISYNAEIARILRAKHLYSHTYPHIFTLIKASSRKTYAGEQWSAVEAISSRRSGEHNQTAKIAALAKPIQRLPMGTSGSPKLTAHMNMLTLRKQSFRSVASVNNWPRPDW